eukprot:scaffold7530_cov144-Skeletonema_marinoi.AAC.6
MTEESTTATSDGESRTTVLTQSNQPHTNICRDQRLFSRYNHSKTNKRPQTACRPVPARANTAMKRTKKW